MTVHLQTPHISDLIRARLSRRGVLGGLGAASLLTLAPAAARAAGSAKAVSFPPVPATFADTVTVPAGYSVRTLISWGDPLFATARGEFNPDTVTRGEQELRFGVNNDMLAIFPARPTYPEPRRGGRAILCANNEHFDTALMFPSVGSPDGFSDDQALAMYAALGVSIVEIERVRGRWRAVIGPGPGSGPNRRITPFTPVRFTGPASSHPWIAAAAAVVDRYEPGAAAGDVACGTMVNCAGGKTPWGTYLTCEEGFPFYFARSDEAAPDVRAAEQDPAYVANARSYQFPLPPARLPKLAPPQFDLARNPLGPSLYGWVVEIDPYEPGSTPLKRTALGRRWNEGATTSLCRDGRVAVYMGDDSPNQFIYKFVSRGRFDPADRRANLGLLDDGVLHVARFSEDGAGRWLPFTEETVAAAARASNHQPPFRDFADMLMRTREAARLLGATPMDRPEDIEPVIDGAWTGLGPVLINCTGSSVATSGTPGNPRRKGEPGESEAQPNYAGHILRLDEAREDAAALDFTWDVFALCGDPAATTATVTTRLNSRKMHVSTEVGGKPTFAGDRFTSPDNICLDSRGNAWITSNGLASLFGDTNDGVFVLPVAEEAPRPSRRFLVGPLGSELCGPAFSFDERTFFVAVQHPGDADAAGREFRDVRWKDPSARPPSSWPRGNGSWPLPSVVYVTKDDAGVIGS